MSVSKMRADELVVKQGLTNSRSEAKALLMAGKIKVGTERIDKPGKLLREDTPLILEKPPRFVSRGGEKLEGILTHLELDVTNQIILDIGASTGGFTDCMLQRGAAHVTCLDVGRNQLHEKIRRDPRVTNIEQYNARNLEAEDLPHSEYDVIVTDVSFISLTKILPAAWKVLKVNGLYIALVKPQFEADKRTMDQCRGVIKDPGLALEIASQVKEFAQNELPDCSLIDFQPSVIQGGDGNQEYLMVLQKAS